MTQPLKLRLRELGYSSYTDYLRSGHWRRLRLTYQRAREWECFVCGELDGLHLHHKTYERIGAERLEDLVPLCEPCHSLLHQLHNEGQASLDPSSLFDVRRALENRIAREQRQTQVMSDSVKKKSNHATLDRFAKYPTERQQLIEYMASQIVTEAMLQKHGKTKALRMARKHIRRVAARHRAS